MTGHANVIYREMALRRHDELLAVLADLEAVQFGYPDELVPSTAIELQAAIWEFLTAYGRRNAEGAVDERSRGAEVEQVAAHAKQVEVFTAERDLESLDVVACRCADEVVQADGRDADAVGLVEAHRSGAGNAVEIVGHDVQHEGQDHA
jgi:hypothetical protein